MARGADESDKTIDVASSRLRVRRLGRSVLVFEPHGHLSLEIARVMIAEAEGVIAEVGKIHALHDWEAVTGYDALSRLELTKFVLVDRNKFRSAHLLVHAKDVAFGVEVANIVLKHKITVHHTRDSFEQALKLILQEERGRPARA